MMNTTIMKEATSSSSVVEDLYEFKDEPFSPVTPLSPGSFRYSSRRESYVPDSATSNSAIGKVAAPCKVCGDKASGYHYGVTSCEGCKGFFRRSIQKQIEYRCLREGKCLVIRLNRNRCQFCRFKKCLTVGMSRDSVRYGRVPKRPRDTASADNLPELSRNHVAIANVDEVDQETQRKGVANELVNMITDAHRAHNAYTEELHRSLQYQTIVLTLNDCDAEASSGEESASSTTDRVSDMRSVLWYNVALRMTPAVQQVVEFAKRLPGFQSLPQDDQLILIKLGFFEVWLTRVTRLSTLQHIVFEDGTAISQKQLIVIYDAQFASAMMSYVQTLMRMQITDEEMAVYTSALLMCPQRLGLSEPEHIGGQQRAINDAFQTIVMSSGAPDADARLDAFAAATLEIRALGARHNDLLAWCRNHWPRLVLPALFSEIFDIPKSEEDEPPPNEMALPAPQVG